MVAIVSVALAALHAHAADSRVTLPNGKKIFVSGMNLAWINFANDVGDTPLDTQKVSSAMKAISDSGANCMRIWLSTNGTNDPKYGSDGLVTGPGSQTIANIQKMLTLARNNNLLLMPVLLTHNWVQNSINPTILANNKTMLKTEAGLQAYIDNYLVPVVTAIGNDPNLICWEICNELEGMVQGWSSPANTITQAEVQRFVNRMAAAIHTAVPGILVSNGAASLQSKDWYTDAELVDAGGEPNGTLDFYMIHFYGWNGTTYSPFLHPCSHWNLDKPLVIGEYASSDWSNSTSSSSPISDGGAKVDTLLTYLNNNGYAGGLGWQYQPDAGDSWMRGFETFGHSLAEVYRQDSASIKLTLGSTSTFSVTASASNGGSVTKSVNGRVDSGATVVITATPAEGYSFNGWSGDTTSIDPVLTIQSVVKDWSIQAAFVPNAGTNLIVGGDFADNSSWVFYVDNTEGRPNEATIDYTDSRANVSITSTDTLNWGIQLSQNDIPLDSGISYIITFDAYSSGERPLYVGVSTYGTWHFQGGGEVSLTTTVQSLTVEITPDSSTTAGVLQFNLGGSTLPIYIDNVSMVRKSTFIRTGRPMIHRGGISFNRVGNRIFWKSPSMQAQAAIIDINGRVVQSATMANPISIDNLSAGIYLFVAPAGRLNHAVRFIKQ